MSKTYKGQITNNVVELTLQDEQEFKTPTIVWDDTVNGEIDQVQGDIPDNWKNGGGIKQLQIGSSCTSIGSSAFYYCSGLTGDLVIPDSVTTIEGGPYAGAFLGTTGFTSLTIGNSVTSIGDYAFNGCTGLTGSLVIPDSVTSIGGYAFESCPGLTGALTIPNSVTSIGSGAFDYCTSLTSLVIPNSVTTIGSFAFGGMTILTTAYLATPYANIPTGSFGSGAFYNSGLTTVYAKDAATNGWTLGAGQTVGGKTGVTVANWNNYPNPIPN